MPEISQLLNAVPMPLIRIGADMRITDINGPAAALFGRVGLGRHFSIQLRQPSVAHLVEEALRHGISGEARFRRVEGQGEQIFRVQATPVEDSVVLAFEDLSQSEAAHQMRRDFVANVSHELKTPLTALIGFIETLRGPARDDAKARERFLGIMERETARMNRLVTDLLSLSRVESVALQRPSGAVDIALLLSSVTNALKPIAQEQGMALNLSVVAPQTVVPGDADQLTQVFQNLIENALKYGGSGGYLGLRLERIAHEPMLRGPAWAVTVEDRGEGIEEQHLPRLTERFYRVDTHRSRAQGGTGLGLAIVKHIINRHRGRLRIDSRRGAGSRFTVILPERSSRG